MIMSHNKEENCRIQYHMLTLIRPTKELIKQPSLRPNLYKKGMKDLASRLAKESLLHWDFSLGFNVVYQVCYLFAKISVL